MLQKVQHEWVEARDGCKSLQCMIALTNASLAEPGVTIGNVLTFCFISCSRWKWRPQIAGRQMARLFQPAQVRGTILL